MKLWPNCIKRNHNHTHHV